MVLPPNHNRRLDAMGYRQCDGSDNLELELRDANAALSLMNDVTQVEAS